MNTPTFQEKIMTSLNLKKDKYPLSETQLSQHDSKKTKTPNNPTSGLIYFNHGYISPQVLKN
ncbi:Uncharacterised protein [Serratia fonticola]|uniref:Uncharacterized protein n=1 Tax=Serratia fonticola TaxID=47917 RepID=A0A4U9W101_SERFO|nr:Uncharacterised protein [Serratia fonticola]